MPEREWEDTFSEIGDRLHVRFVTKRGEVVDYVVRYETVIDGQRVQVVRCDGSHRRGRCDVLDRRGNTVRKVWSRHGHSLGLAMTEAIDDLTANWRRYRAAFLRRP